LEQFSSQTKKLLISSGENFGYFSKTKLIQAFQQYSLEYRRGDREIYNRFFRADVIANFTFTRLVSDCPKMQKYLSYKISNGEDDES